MTSEWREQEDRYQAILAAKKARDDELLRQVGELHRADSPQAGKHIVYQAEKVGDSLKSARRSAARRRLK